MEVSETALTPTTVVHDGLSWEIESNPLADDSVWRGRSTETHVKTHTDKKMRFGRDVALACLSM